MSKPPQAQETLVKRLYTIKDTAAMLNVSVRTIRKLISTGELPKPLKVLSVCMYTLKDIDDYITRITNRR